MAEPGRSGFGTSVDSAALHTTSVATATPARGRDATRAGGTVVPQGREPAVDPTAPTTASTRSKPAILAVDDAGPVLAAVVRDLRRRYAARFRILPTSDSLAALSTLEELALAEDPVALIVADQRMPALSGTDLLTQVADSAPRRPRRPADRVHRHRRDRGDSTRSTSTSTPSAVGSAGGGRIAPAPGVPGPQTWCRSDGLTSSVTPSRPQRLRDAVGHSGLRSSSSPTGRPTSSRRSVISLPPSRPRRQVREPPGTQHQSHHRPPARRGSRCDVRTGADLLPRRASDLPAVIG